MVVVNIEVSLFLGEIDMDYTDDRLTDSLIAGIGVPGAIGFLKQLKMASLFDLPAVGIATAAFCC